MASDLFHKIDGCRVCGNKDIITVLDLGDQFLSGIFPKKIDLDMPRGPLKLVKCNEEGGGCGHVQLEHTYDLPTMYGDNYGYRSGLNASMVKHLEKKSKDILDHMDLKEGDIVVDIAGNDGTFLGFFDDNFRLGWAWYRTLFPTTITRRIIKRKTGKFLTFDDTPFYIYNEDVAKKIKNYFPKTKVIIILRNPIERAYSNYHLAVRMGDEKRTFDQTIDDEIQKIGKYDEIKMDDFISQSYLGRGFYAKQLEIWLKYFPASVIKVLESNRFANNTKEVMNEIFEFLDLPDHDITNLEKKNVAEYPPMRIETRQKLCDFFSEYNEKLYDMLKVRYDWS